jgi:hypothetical protein
VKRCKSDHFFFYYGKPNTALHLNKSESREQQKSFSFPSLLFKCQCRNFIPDQLIELRTLSSPHPQTPNKNMQSQFLCLFVILVTIGSSISSPLQSKTNTAQRQQPFFATKGGQQRLAQQQQQEEEAALPGFVEPPAAPVPEPDAGQPMMPYEFEYSAAATGGSSARRESNDGTRVTGTYTLAGPDGINRVVHYVADKDGFRATIVTNEPGTESQSPSGVILNSSQLPGDQIALQYGE